MSTPEPVARAEIFEMPDIAADQLEAPEGTLDWVGMSAIHQPVTLRVGDTSERVVAKVQVYVDLADPHAKGIHMSRLYLLLDEHARTRPLSASGLKMLANALLRSHDDLSTRAFVEFTFDYPRRRGALLSDNAGWSAYPATVSATLEDGELRLEVGVEVLYSSTCPCSAALARQLIQQSFDQAFAGDAPLDPDAVRAWLGTSEGIVATPHSQRSVARVKTRLDSSVDYLPLDDLIDSLESAIGTPVQTAVKREDEQAFALRNGQNLMFCEDAGRKLKRALDRDPRIADFWVRIEHQESLHAHDAVSVVTKGLEGGYLPIP